MVLAPFAGVLASVGGRISMGCKIGAEQDRRPFPLECRCKEQVEPVVLRFTADDAARKIAA
jgi:hypothetical protein